MAIFPQSSSRKDSAPSFVGKDAPPAREQAPAEVIIAHHDVVINSGDHLIVFVENRRIISKIEKLFQVNVGFF